MKIMALDASTKSTGVAIFNDKELIYYECIATSSSDVIKRIQVIIKRLNEILFQHADIEKVILEEVRPEETIQNMKTHRALMWMQAAINFLLHENYPKMKVEYVYPNSWRSACGIRTGRGMRREALKVADINFVKETYNITVNDDIADAIGIGHAFVNQLNNEINWE